MNDSRRDELIVEMHQDIKWLIKRDEEHKQSHSKYLYYMITVFIACVLSWFK